MTGKDQASQQHSRWRYWLAGRTLRARLIAGLIVLFAVACVGVGLVTTAELSNFLLSRLDQQVNTAGRP
jgi:two-component system, OmpR family, sensor kinase